MNVRRLIDRTALLLVLTCIARGAPHDFFTGTGTCPGAPGDPNSGQPLCHSGSSSDPDAAGDSDPVDLFRGELILDRRDLFVPGRGLSVDVTFHYRSQSVENGQFGYGWMCGLQEDTLVPSYNEERIARRIEEILRIRQSPLADELAKVDRVRALPVGVRERITEELAEEFSRRGLGPDSEPNAYGLEIEGLTDACAPWSQDQ